jgi:hypothetical protein
MLEPKYRTLEILGFILVLLMVLLQGGYAIYAYVDPAAFASLRGTELLVARDADWVKIYASRTLFVALIIGFLLYSKNYRVLVWASLFGAVMPITDAFLAYQAQAPDKVVLKHIMTVVYLLFTFVVLQVLVRKQEKARRPT